MLLTTYNFTEADVQSLANQVKEVLLLSLEREGALNKSAQELLENYAIVVSKKGWLGQYLDRILGGNPNDMRLTLVRVIPMMEKSD